MQLWNGIHEFSPGAESSGGGCALFFSLLFSPLLRDLFWLAFGAQVVFTSTVLIVEWQFFLSFPGLSSWYSGRLEKGYLYCTRTYAFESSLGFGTSNV